MKKVIGIYCGGGSSLKQWDDEIVRNHGAGGSETWAVEVASEFQRRGYHVIVFGNPPYWRFAVDGVEYVPKENLKWRCEYQHFDYFISSREFIDINGIVNCEHKYIMAHDPCIFGDKLQAFNFKRIFYLSEWQKQFISNDIGIYNNSYYVKTKNGINLSNYSNVDLDMKENCMIWSTVADRGFGFFMNHIFPEIKKEVHDFCVYCASYEPSGFEKWKNVDGVIILPILGKKELSDIQKKCKIWIYPNIGFLENGTNVPIHETFCITAIENAYAKNAIISSWNSGIKDTLCGYSCLFGKDVIEYGDYSPKMLNEAKKFIVENSIKVLKDDIYRKKLVEEAYNICQKYTWENVVNDWLREWNEKI